LTRLARDRSIRSHMGSFGSRGEIHWRIRKTPVVISVSKVRARLHDLVFPRQINLTFGRRSRRLHHDPACGGWGSGRRNHSGMRILGHESSRFVHPDPPEPIGSWKIGEFGQRLSSSGFHHGSFDDDAGGDIFPQRHKQLARQRHDGRLLETAAVAPDPFFKPQSQRRSRLMAQP